jgi:carbonic anhydrase/acetyltransferase-like protein (isoleucine patch superfamily)
MAHVLPFGKYEPEIDEGVFLAPTATVIGRVRIEKGASVWFGAVLRGDLGPVHLGPGAVVEDNCVLHADAVLEEGALLGHSAVVEAATIRAGALIGNGSLLFEGVDIGEQAMVAAGSVVRGLKVPPRVLVAGNPATVRKELSGSAAWWVGNASSIYSRLAAAYTDGFTDEELDALTTGPWKGEPTTSGTTRN